jgi:hypothetical protein
MVLPLPNIDSANKSPWRIPDKREKLLNRIRSMRGGKLNDPRFGQRMTREGNFADQIEQMFNVAYRRVGIADNQPSISSANFRRLDGQQLGLFGPRRSASEHCPRSGGPPGLP